MYLLISAIAKPIEQNSQWAEISIGEMKLSVIYQTYSKVYAVLKNTYMTDNVCLDLDSIRPDYLDSELTFMEFLTQNGNNALSTQTEIPSLEPKYAKYADALHAGYTVTPYRPATALDADLPLMEKTSLHLSRPNTDYELFLSTCLVSVNGYYHLTDGGKDGISVLDGMKSVFVSGMNHMGILSFRELGTIQRIPIKPNMLYKNHERELYRDRVHINLSDANVDFSNKTVILVLGGYLHIADPKTFHVVGDAQLSVNVANMPLLERYYESMGSLDLAALPMQRTTKNPTQVAVNDFYSDANIAAYFTLPQSFVVVLDNDNVQVERGYVEKTPLPNMYVCHEKPRFPLVTGYGKTSNYWYTVEDKQYAINCVNSLRANYLFHTADISRVVNVSSARKPSNPVENSSAYFLKISSQL